jgi:hypothetical protein
VGEHATPSTIAPAESAWTYTAFSRLSPCRTVEKNQDRVDVRDTKSAWFASVCDGATQSMRSVEAAEIICSNPAELWVDGILSERVERVRSLRQELITSEPPGPVDETSFLSRAFAEIVREKRKQAFQTTLVSARITPFAPGKMLLEAKTCGDSALLVFDWRGRLLFSSPHVEDESSPFGHVSPVTEVLPDHFRGEAPNCTAEIDADAHIILCSDGFYDAFPNPGALFRWLLLNGADPESALDELHMQLDCHHGDDDISFVWLCPRAVEIPVPEPPRTTPDVGSPRRMLVAFATLLRRCADWIVRFEPTVFGGIAP